MGVGGSAAYIEIYYIFQRFDTAIVHVWTGLRDVAQGWGPKSAAVCIQMRFIVASLIFQVAIGIDADSNVMELAIGEQGGLVFDGVAGHAVAPGLIAEDFQPADRGWRQGGFIAAILIAIEGRVAAEQGALEAGNGLFDL